MVGEGRAQRRRERLSEAIDHYPTDGRINIDALVDDRDGPVWCLVERSLSDGLHWISIHEGPGKAATYHLNQENRNGWEVVALVNLDDGESYEPVYRLEFRRGSVVLR